MTRHVLAAALAAALAGCAATGGRGGLPAGWDAAGREPGPAREVLLRFVQALQADRFEEALGLASARWRRAYTPGRLALDWRGAGAGGRELSGKVLERLAAGAEPAIVPPRALLSLGDGTAAVLVAEEGVWRVDALDAAER